MTKPFLFTGILLMVIIGFFVVGIVFAKNTDHSLFLFSTKHTPIIQNQPNKSKETELPSVSNQEISSENDQQDIATQAIALTNTQTTQHLTTPTPVRAIYISAWTASSKKNRDALVKFITDSGATINAVIIDIKDATGRVSFLIDEPMVADTGSPKNTITDIAEFINELHQKNIYVIGRISVFQDPYLTTKYPNWAIQSIATRKPWKDRKGLSFLDPTNQQVWDYVVALAQNSYKKGFDEINFDYIRFPSDGNMKDIAYPNHSGSRADIIKSFFEYLHKKMVASSIPTSADLFGLTTEAVDDMGIGQVLENVLPNFDFIAPMVYPSHYGKGYGGFTNPADHPYEVIKQAMREGVKRAKVLGFGPEKFRPWIQDFSMGATYDRTKILDQIRALDEQGIHGFMVWDPANCYTREAYNN